MLMTRYTYEFLDNLNDTNDKQYFINCYNISVLNWDYYDYYCNEHNIDDSDSDSGDAALQAVLNKDPESFVATLSDLNLQIQGLTEEYIPVWDLLYCTSLERDIREIGIPLTYKLTQFEYNFLRNMQIGQETTCLKYYLAKDFDGTVKLYNKMPTCPNEKWITDGKYSGMICDLSDIDCLSFNAIGFECVLIDDILADCCIIDEY